MSLLVSFEGIDGSGKTTLIKNLEKNAELRLEIGSWRSSELGKKIWNLINDSRNEAESNLPSTWSYIFLILITFDELAQKIIKPNLEKNKIVILDRYLDSTFVYQGLESNLEISIIQWIAKKTIKLPLPDLTFVLDIEPTKAQERLRKRKKETGEYTNWDNLNLDFHQRIRNHYLELKEFFPERIKIINADRNQKEILEEIIAIIKKKIQTKQNNPELTKKTIDLSQEGYSSYQNEEDQELQEKMKIEEEEKERKYEEEAKKRININCLYEYFKNTPKKLKVVCDWDEVIQSLEPKVYYELSEREGAYYDTPWWMPNGTKFEKWFKNFWLNPPISYSNYGSHSVYTDESMIKSCIGNSGSFSLGPRNIKDKINKIKNETDFYEKTPFLTIAKELLKLVKENKVETIFLSAYDKRAFADGDPRKKKIFGETFGKFPNCSLNLVGFESEGKGQSKSEWIKENAPNCDIVIDDNPNILANVLKEKQTIIALAPYYSPIIEHHEKVLLVKTSISNLKKEDFNHE